MELLCKAVYINEDKTYNCEFLKNEEDDDTILLILGFLPIPGEKYRLIINGSFPLQKEKSDYIEVLGIPE